MCRVVEKCDENYINTATLRIPGKPPTRIPIPSGLTHLLVLVKRDGELTFTQFPEVNDFLLKIFIGDKDITSLVCDRTRIPKSLGTIITQVVAKQCCNSIGELKRIVKEIRQHRKWLNNINGNRQQHIDADHHHRRVKINASQLCFGSATKCLRSEVSPVKPSVPTTFINPILITSTGTQTEDTSFHPTTTKCAVPFDYSAIENACNRQRIIKNYSTVVDYLRHKSGKPTKKPLHELVVKLTSENLNLDTLASVFDETFRTDFSAIPKTSSQLGMKPSSFVTADLASATQTPTVDYGLISSMISSALSSSHSNFEILSVLDELLSTIMSLKDDIRALSE